jgi:ABC-type enterochelin transport system permease subunit
MELLFSIVLGKYLMKIMIHMFHFVLTIQMIISALFSQLSNYFVICLEGAADYFLISRTIHSIAAVRFSSVD